MEAKVTTCELGLPYVHGRRRDRGHRGPSGLPVPQREREGGMSERLRKFTLPRHATSWSISQRDVVHPRCHSLYSLSPDRRMGERETGQTLPNLTAPATPR